MYCTTLSRPRNTHTQTSVFVSLSLCVCVDTHLCKILILFDLKPKALSLLHFWFQQFHAYCCIPITLFQPFTQYIHYVSFMSRVAGVVFYTHTRTHAYTNPCTGTIALFQPFTQYIHYVYFMSRVAGVVFYEKNLSMYF